MTVVKKPGDIYTILELDLSEARDGEEVIVTGYRIIRLYLDGELKLAIKEKDNPQIDLRYTSDIISGHKPFKYLYFFNPAQSGKKAILLVGKTPWFLATATRMGAVQLLDTDGVTINPATEDTLSALKDNVASGVKVQKSDGTVINPATEDTLSSISSNIDVALSTRASESTLSSILDKLDVALSTRATESTLSAILERLKLSKPRLKNITTNSSAGTVDTVTLDSSPVASIMIHNKSDSYTLYVSFDGGTNFKSIAPGGVLSVDRIDKSENFTSIAVKSDGASQPVEIIYQVYV